MNCWKMQRTRKLWKIRANSPKWTHSTPDTNVNFDVLLTVHLSIILVINQLNEQILVL